MTGVVGTSHSKKSGSIGLDVDTNKAWITWTTGSSAADVRESFGYSSATWNEVGKTTLNFSKAQPTAHFHIGYTQITQYGYAGDAVNTTNQTTTDYSHHYREQAGTARDGNFRSFVYGF